MLGTKYLGRDFLGVYPAKQAPKANRHGYYLVNTDDREGEHWMAVALEAKHKPLLFDSFGRIPSDEWQPWLKHMQTTDPDRDQAYDTVICGPLSLAWCMLHKQRGRNYAMKI